MAMLMVILLGALAIGLGRSDYTATARLLLLTIILAAMSVRFLWF